MKLKAIDDGFLRGSRIRAGAVFEIEDGKPVPKWALPVDAPSPAKKPQKKPPRTFSEIANGTISETP